MCVYINTCHVSGGDREGRQRALDPLELDLSLVEPPDMSAGNQEQQCS